MSSPRVLLIDGNWYLHRVWHVTATRYPPERLGRYIPLQLLAMVARDAINVRATHLAVLFDGAEPFRYTLFPEYKSSRHSHGPIEGGKVLHDEQVLTPYSFFPEVYAALAAAGFKHVTLKTMEADDLLASGAQALKKKNRIFLAVKDKDVMQAVDTTVTQYWPAQQQREAEEITPKDVKRIRGVMPIQMPELQTLVGDPTDDIPSIGDIRLKKAKKILSEYATVAEALKSKEYGPALKPHAKQIALNRQLVTLRIDCWKPSLRDVQVGPLKVKALVNMFGRVPTGVEEFHAQLQLRSTKGLFR